MARLSLSTSEASSPHPSSLERCKLARAGSAGPAARSAYLQRAGKACESLVGEKESLRCVLTPTADFAGIARVRDSPHATLQARERRQVRDGTFSCLWKLGFGKTERPRHVQVIQEPAFGPSRRSMRTPLSRVFSAKKGASDPSKSPRVAAATAGKFIKVVSRRLVLLVRCVSAGGPLSWYPVT